MYIPRSYAEPDAGVLHAFMEAHPFATLVTAAEGLFATHLPLILRRGDGEFGTLEGHVARANPHHRRTASSEALVIFAGPDAHITPSWYPSKAEDGRVVPTWNYVAVHAYGDVRFIDDVDFLRGHVARWFVTIGQARGSAWTTDDPPEGYVDQQLKAIVGVEITITRLEGKWKMSQNRSAEDVAAVVSGLRSTGSADDAAVADVISPA